MSDTSKPTLTPEQIERAYTEIGTRLRGGPPPRTAPVDHFIERRLPDRWIGTPPEGPGQPRLPDNPVDAAARMTPVENLPALSMPPTIDAGAVQTMRRAAGLADTVAIPASLDVAHTTLAEARTAYAAASTRLADAERALASAQAQLAEAEHELDQFGDLDLRIREEQATRIAAGLTYEISPGLVAKREAARAAREKMEDLRGVVDALAGEVEVAKVEADATQERLVEASVAVLGVQFQTDVLARLTAAKVEVSRLQAEAAAAVQWFGVGDIRKRVAVAASVTASIDAPAKKLPVAEAMSQWRAKFEQLMQGEGE